MPDDRAKHALPQLEGAVQFDLHFLVLTSDLPGIRVAEPVVRLFKLPAVADSLPEHAVFVPQSVAHSRELHRGHRVEEARRQAPETAVTQARIGFSLEQFEPVEVLLPGRLLREGFEQEVGHIVRQRASEKKLHREIIDALGVLVLVGLLRAQPALREDISHGAGDRLEAFPWTGRRRIDDVVEDEVPLVKRVAGPRELDRAASVLLEEMRKITASLICGIHFFLFASSNDRKLLSRRFLILLPPEAEF